jgi:predicted SnoaL-like aldol condensation-catalyzing enzyme
MNNKDTALSFLRLVTSGKIREAYDKHVAPGFIHHNPYFKGNADSLRAGMEESEERFPGKNLEVQRSFEEGELVAVHSKVTLVPGKMVFGTVHIFRLKNGRIAELWDIAQQVPESSPNPHGMF